MIITINLSYPRRLSCNFINNLILKAKLSKSDQNWYKYFSLFLIALLFENNTALAEEVSKNSLILDNPRFWKAIETYTFPTVYSLYEIIKIYPYLLQYIKIKFKD